MHHPISRWHLLIVLGKGNLNENTSYPSLRDIAIFK